MDLNCGIEVARGVCAVPNGTQFIILILPGTAVPGYRLLRPFGTEFILLLPVSRQRKSYLFLCSEGVEQGCTSREIAIWKEGRCRLFWYMARRGDG
jgi:hypothetical protein